MTVDARVEAHYDGAWQDITDDVDLDAQSVGIDYGQPDEHAEATPSTVTLTLDDGDRKYGPNDPEATLFGKFGRGTPLRVRIGGQDGRLVLPGVEGSYASTPDDASIDITGDIDIRIDVTPTTWRPVEDIILAGRWAGGDSWMMVLRSDGELKLFWNDGSSTIIHWSNVGGVPESSTRLTLRITMDVDDGAGNRLITYYTGESLDGPWTTLDTDGGTATSIAATDVDLTIGATSDGGTGFVGTSTFDGSVHGFRLYDGIDGTLVADLEFTTEDPESRTVVDDTNLTWTLNEQAWIIDASVRGSGSIVSLRQSWDATTITADIGVQAAGILRRLGQGKKPLRSSLYRDLTTADNIVAYWPLEDDEAAGRFTAAVGNSVLRIDGDVDMARVPEFPGSAAVPALNAGVIRGRVPPYSGDADQRFSVLVSVPEDGHGDTNTFGLTLLRVWLTGSVNYADIDLFDDGRMEVQFVDHDLNILQTSAKFGALNGQPVLLSLWLSQNGNDIDWQVSWWEIGDSAPTVSASSSDTLTGHDFGRARQIWIGGYFSGDKNDFKGTGVGHYFIMNGDVHSGFWATGQNSLVAWAGETAGDRVLRLTSEENIPLRLHGDPSLTVPMGAQARKRLLDILQECADSDLAVYGEERSAPRLLWRARHTLYNQEPALTLDMSKGHIANPFDPTLDDQSVRNEVTVTRDGGGEHTETLASGALSVQDPPDGIGRYETGPTVSLESDSQLADQASWRLRLGTVEGHRVASLTLAMHHRSSLQDQVLALQAGDLVRVTNPPTGSGPGPIDLIVRGWPEKIDDQTWMLTLQLSPGSPWDVWVLEDDDLGRIDTDGSELASSVSDSDTSLSVAITDGELWVTDPGELPLDIRVGGEVMTVTAISGTSSPQTFTVTRSVNGITKSHAAGADVRLATPAIVAL